jgi:benzoyl-CoA reductase/2-hydroxyglutaryl-CoA dehydratase subunit BcrC/BadD/HgdB
MRVFLTSPWIPPEWIRAHGLESGGIWSEAEFRRGALPLGAGICAFADSVVHFAGTHPDSAVIFTTSCDQLRRGFDVAAFRGQSRAFLFNLPATQTSAAKQIYRAEVKRLGQFLVELGGSSPAPEILRREMLHADEDRRRSRESISVTPGTQVPLAVIGGPLCKADANLFDMIEAAGGRIVLDASENGERSLCPQFDWNAADPVDALVNGYFDNITDVFQRPNTRLYSWLKPRLQSRQVRGIVLWHFTGCDLWRAEAQTLREASGLPILLLEAGEPAGISPRDLNRLQAFVETLK